MIAALVPIAISRYGADGHTLWFGCAAFALTIWAAFVIALSRTADSRLVNRSPEPLDRFFPVVGLPLHVVIAGSMVLVMLGAWSGKDEALYATGLVAGVVFAAYTLLALVLSQGRQAGQDESTEDG